METDEQNEDFQRLHQLIDGKEDLKGFLNGTTKYAARALTRATGVRVECAVTLHRRKRAATIAGSSDDAILLDGIEQRLDDGPCMEALRTGVPVVVIDAATETRWPAYARNLTVAGARSALGVPMELGDDASAGLNFFSDVAGLFTEGVIEEAVTFADMASQALRLALRIATADLLAKDLKAAMERRTVIDLATGIVMSQNRCSQEEAFAVMLRASQNRNQKLHDVARDMLRSLAGNTDEARTHFDD
ncbi:GAF and ANTAR domain-containing protein [Paenarthrobacter ureafaciens]|uniref:GAF and ANTAR domain-containing protein n=1 Tax=Paenarthrobacter ureafaciens TaxID=37931 RepID=UPI00140B8D45|nr:GAF and ANTAR domain-containing protein [Paenarthrobacter ureafaciens]MCX8456088.1 GAF and ANTAR domain-containing protein [Paenarthrobacter ureafaciens]MCY0973637.1 GAF and ANTAR domain-containing protein [Paenarthrobacter ureafaciens]